MALTYRPDITTGLITSAKTIDECYLALACAVVALAANDYREAMRDGDKYRMISIERFFYSPLFEAYSLGRIDPNYILAELRAEGARKKLGRWSE